VSDETVFLTDEEFTAIKAAWLRLREVEFDGADCD
jgi:hypothetical protein